MTGLDVCPHGDHPACCLECLETTAPPAAPRTPDLGQCRSCRADVRWVRNTKTGKAMPLDPDPVDDGNVVLTGVWGVSDFGAIEHAEVLPEAQLLLFGDDRPQYQSHFRSCPDADDWWRHLVLRHDGATFLERWGLDLPLFGVYVHHIAAPDPGMDHHDHPWPFVTIILWGGYREWTTTEVRRPKTTDMREWKRGSVHRFGLHQAHRIVWCQPHTWTLVLRGRKTRTWGFFPPEGWVHYLRYDYATRRPCTVQDTDRHEVEP